jgi:flagellar biosynthesis protein FliR
MINTELATLMTLLQQFLWPFIRIGAFLLVSPLYSIESFTVRLRVALAMILTLFTLDNVMVPQSMPFDASSVGLILGEILVGALLGFSLQVVNSALAIGGAAISNAMGLSFANIVDPALGNIPVVSQFFVIFATLIFLGLDGHLQLIRLLIDSFTLLPIGELPDFGRWYDVLVVWLPEMFVFGLSLALPVAISLLLMNLGLGLVTRAAPAMNIFSIGFPALLLCGLVFLFLSLPGLAAGIEIMWQRSLDTAGTLLGR